jgi:hypothetical protein
MLISCIHHTTQYHNTISPWIGFPILGVTAIWVGFVFVMAFEMILGAAGE